MTSSSNGDGLDDVARMAQQLSTAPDLATTAAQVTAFACARVGAADAGITLVRGSRMETVGATSDHVLRVDEAQYAAGQGPCVEAATTSRTVWSGDLAGDDRWPVWGPLAAAMGFSSVLSTELHAGGRRVGALNLYGRGSDVFADDDAERAHGFAQHAAIALHHARQVEDLTVAVQTRTVIGQAQGLLMERHGLGPDQSFAVLRRYSQEANVKLRVVAEHLVRTRTLPPRPETEADPPTG